MSFRVNIGIHWRNSIHWQYNFDGDIGHNARQASATADAPDLHRKFVDSDATLLG